jgi:hypothetical protein
MARWKEVKGREGRERRGEGMARHARKARGICQSPAAGCCPAATGILAICATLDLLLKHIQINICNMRLN